MIVGSGNYTYERVDGWAKLPEYFSLGEPVAAAVDSQDRVFIFCRAKHPVLIFDRDGDFISCWGEGSYDPGAHAIFIGPDDSVYLTDYQVHTVEKFTPGGELLMRLGTKHFGMPPFLRLPFCMPSGLAIGPSGDLFISDGYAGFVVHRFSPDGQLLKTWGQFGHGPGEFAWPHAIGVDRHGTVYVCDRENDRIQLFTSDGELIAIWTDFNNPNSVYIDQRNDIIYVVESQLRILSRPQDNSRVSVRDLKGTVLASWQGRESDGHGVLEFCHDICVDAHGDLYITDHREVNRIQKFMHVS